MGEATINIKIDIDLLNQVEEICKKEGITVEDAFNVFVTAVVRDKSVLEQMLEDEYDIALAEEAHAEFVRSGKKCTPFSEFMKELDLEKH